MEILQQIQDKLAQIKQTASQLPQGANVTSASQATGGITKQVQSMVPPVSLDQTEAPTPPTFEASPPPDDMSLKVQLGNQRAFSESYHQVELDRADKQLEEAKKQEAEYLKKQEGVMQQADLLTQPFREGIEKAERDRLKTEENFFANQALTNELDGLLTESMELTRKLQSQRVPGLAGLQQSSRMIKAQETAQGRIAVIEAVLLARNNEIVVAERFINRSLEAIQNDRQSRLGYLQNLYNFYEKTRSEAGTKIFNLTIDQKEIFDRQRGLLEADLQRAERTADMIKEMMLENPKMAAESGISLTDTEEQIIKKVAKWQYSEEIRTVKNQAGEKGMRSLSATEASMLNPREVFTYTDSKDKNYYFQIPTKWDTQMIDGSLYRIDPSSGKSEMIIRETSPKELALFQASLKTSDSSKARISGVEISGPTNRVFEGLVSVDDLTSTELVSFQEDLIKLGATSDKVPSWFKEIMDAKTGGAAEVANNNRLLYEAMVKREWNNAREEWGIETSSRESKILSKEQEAALMGGGGLLDRIKGWFK